MITKTFISLVILSLLFIPSYSQTINAVSQEFPDSVIFYGYKGLAPIIDIDSSGNLYGYAIDLLNLLSVDEQISFRIKNSDSYTQALDAASKSSGHFLTVTAKNPYLKENLSLSIPLFYAPVVIATRGDSLQKNVLIENLRGENIAVISGFSPEIYLSFHYPDYKLLEVETVEEGLSALESGYADYFIHCDYSIKYHIKEDRFRNIAIVSKTDFSLDYCFATFKNDSILSKKIDRFLTELSERDKSALLLKWGMTDSHSHKISRRLLAGIVIFGIFIIVIFCSVLIWNHLLAKRVAQKSEEIKAQMMARQESEKLYKVVTENLDEGLGIVDEHENFIFVNKALSNILGETQESLLRMNLADFLSPSDIAKAREGTARRLRGQSERYELKFRLKDGAVKDIAIAVSPWFDETNSYIGSIGLLSDITINKRNEEQLIRTNETLRIISSAGEAIVKDGLSPDIIQRMLTNLGQVTDVCRVYIFENIQEHQGGFDCIDRFEWIAPRAAAINETMLGMGWNYEHSGLQRWVDLMQKGETIIGHTRQFPEKESDFLKLQNIKSLLIVPIHKGSLWWGFIGFDQCNFEREWSGGEIEALRTAADIIGAALLNEASTEAARRATNQLKMNESRLETLYRLSQMEASSIDEIASYILKEGIELTGSQIGFLGIMNEDESVFELHSVSESVMEGCSVKDTMIHYPIASAGIWGDAVRLRKPIVINDYSAPHESKKGYPEGHINIERFICVPIFEGHKIAALAALGNKASDYDESDIRQISLLGLGAWQTIRKFQTDNSIKQSELRYRTLFENSLDAVYVTTENGIMLDINQAGLELFGRSKAEMIGIDIHSIYYDRRDRDKFLAEITKKGYIKNYELLLKRKNGEPIECLVTAVIRLGADGKTRLFQGIIRDKTETMKLQKQLLQAQKMESVGRLAGGVAHDFNNLLTAITGNAELLLFSLNINDPLREGIDEILKASERASVLTRQLLAFSRKQTLQPKVINLNQTISNMDKMLRRIIGEDISLVTVGVENLWKVRLDPNQVEQIIINLAVNARDAMPSGGKLTIETANVELDDEYVLSHGGASAGKYVMMAVSDSGFGMSADIKEQIFDPFFTTKDPGKGTGLGLSTVYGIVKQSGGNIYVYSEPGKGTSFKVYFPIVEQMELDSIESFAAPADAPRGSEKIIVAEDDGIVRNMTVRFLKMQGYEVFEAQTGADAFMLVQKLGGMVDLLITDVVMPNMSGVELAKLVGKINPDIKVLYMSGYTPNAIVHDGILDQGVAYIQKPFRPIALAVKIREVLSK